MISVIVPTFDRIENLRLCLAALEYQTLPKEDFEVIVVDDGSTDGTWEWLRNKHFHNLDIKYLSAGPNQGFRAGRARNFGAANCHPDTSLFVFIDSDNLMPPDILQKYMNFHSQHPDGIIVGLYHFLYRMEFNEDNLRNDPDFWFKLESMNYPRLPMPPDASLKGRKDLRYNNFPDEPAVEIYANTGVGLSSALGCFSGNIGYPKDVFWDIGGFWEELVGHGGEDAALALAAVAKGHKFIRVKSLVGYHVWHARFAPEPEMVKQKDANIEKIDKRFKIGRHAEATIDCDELDKLRPRYWTSPMYYHKEKGARLVIDPGGTYWAITGEFCLGISTPAALDNLGFEFNDADSISLEQLEEFKVGGVA